MLNSNRNFTNVSEIVFELMQFKGFILTVEKC